MMPRVYNRHHVHPRDAVYVGRPSKWGNRFSHMGGAGTVKVGSRGEAIRLYKMWLLEQDDLMAALPELRGRDLLCSCAPEPCHADVLLQLANQEA